MEFIDELWEDGIIIENFLKDFAYYAREEFKKNNLNVDFTLKTISSIYYILNEFKYEEDKRLLGYVLVNELYKSKDKSLEENVVETVSSKTKINDIPKINVINTDNNETRQLNISNFIKEWNNFKLEVRKISAMLAAFIIESKPTRIEGNTLIITLPNEQKFHQEKIMELKNKQSIEDVLKKFFNLDINLLVEREGEKHKSQDTFVNKVIEFFDAEVVEKK